MRSALQTLLITAAAAAALLGGVSPALAGTYTVSACSPSTSPGAWIEANTAPSGLAAGAACGGAAIGPLAGGDQGALYAEDILTSPAAIPNGALAGWTFTAPPSTTITAISYYRALASYSEPDLVAGLFQGSGAPLEQCMIGLAFGSSITCSMPNTQVPVTFSGLNTSSLFFGVTCHVVTTPGASCVAGGTIHYAQADLYSAQVTLSETALPTLAQPAGALWSGGVISGAVPVTFAASDPSGIQQAVVRGDTGQTVSSAAQACNFTAVVPCPQLPSGLLSVDTTRVPDGPHTFTLVVSDAAGNTQSAVSPGVIVDNNGPPPPSAFAATAQSSKSKVIDLSWRNPTSPPLPVVGAMVELCQASCAAPVAVSSSGRAQATAPATGAYTVRLWLVDSQGRGSASNAAVAHVSVPAADGATPGHADPGTGPPASGVMHKKLVATIKGRILHVTGTLPGLAKGKVKVSWRSHLLRHTLRRGSRTVVIHDHKLSATFTIPAVARNGTIGVAVRFERRVLVAGAAHQG